MKAIQAGKYVQAQDLRVLLIPSCPLLLMSCKKERRRMEEKKGVYIPVDATAKELEVVGNEL